jgi:hypothetical protein
VRGVALYVVKRWAFRLSLIVVGLVLAWLVSVGDALGAEESPSPSPTPTPTPTPSPTPTPDPLLDLIERVDAGFETVQLGTYVVVALLTATVVLHLRPRA